MFPRFNNSLVFGLGTKLMKLLMRDRNERQKLKREQDMKCKWGGCHLFAPVSEMSLAKKLELSRSKFYRYFIQITRTRESQTTSILMIQKSLSGKFRTYFCQINFRITKRTKELLLYLNILP